MGPENTLRTYSRLSLRHLVSKLSTIIAGIYLSSPQRVLFSDTGDYLYEPTQLSVLIITLLLYSEYNYHDATPKFVKKLSDLGNKMKRFCVIKKRFSR